jgi:Capsule assembly protein Wzi
MPGYSIESGEELSAGKQTPFWLMSDQYGLITPNKTNSWIRLGLKTNLTDARKIDYDYGIDVIGRLSKTNKLYLHQAYLRLKFHFVNLQAGSMEEKFGNQDSSLSSGGLLWSGNARPMPKVSVIVPDYTPVPFTGKYLEFKGGISHGWFGDNQFVKDTWLHHKYFYLQLGGRLPVHIHFGFQHFAQWGGKSTDPAIGKMPQGFRDFIKVFFAKQGGSNSPGTEQLNALGNHLGSRNFGVDAEFSRLKAGIYWQTIFEDSSGRAFRNIKDGLWGIYIHTKDKDKIINGFVYEFLNTTDQSGNNDSYWLLNGIHYSYPVPGGVYHWPVGNDNYFNNTIYRFGWTFHDLVIGTPLITSPAVLKTIDNQDDYVVNNKVICHHIGLEGKSGNLLYKILATYYLNFGTNNSPIKPPMSQYSFLFQVQIVNTMPWGIIATVALGVDHGKFYGNNTGLRISLLKQVIK